MQPSHCTTLTLYVNIALRCFRSKSRLQQAKEGSVSMNGFSLHPNVYAAGPFSGLIRMLEQIWVRDLTLGHGTLFIVSGFGNYNGGVRFFETFKHHVERGGRVVSFFAGSAAQKLTSKQLVEEMLRVGAEVHIVNRKRLLHAKCYGTSVADGDQPIVTSGNFTGPGMSQNVEASLLLDRDSTRAMGFSWAGVIDSFGAQTWDRYTPALEESPSPAWRLLYDEFARDVVLDESEETTLMVTLGHADTVRIQAAPGTTEGRGSQYFWLSRDSYGFFPPLTERNRRGHKATFSCVIKIHYLDLRETHESRVTFEAENNLDFRLGTGPLRYTGLAESGDLVVLSRISETDYELRIAKQGTALYSLLRPYAIHMIGHQGKQYGYLDNADFTRLTGVRLPSVSRQGFI